MRGASVEALSVVWAEDWPLVKFTDGQIYCACSSRYERDDGGFVALADDAKGAVPAFEREVFDVGRACLGHS